MSVVVDAREVQIGLNAEGCGHLIIMTPEHHKACIESGRTWYCTICGKSRKFVNETLQEKLDKANRQLAEERQKRWNTEERLSQEQRSKARLKKRLKAGVCPCCTRSFQNLRRHIATKHPTYAAE